MPYFAGLDLSMETTHVCVVDADGKRVFEAAVESHPAAIAAALSDAVAANRSRDQCPAPLAMPLPISKLLY